MISLDDLGTWSFDFQAKLGNLEGGTTALAFIKTLDPNNGYMTTRAIVDAHGAAPVAALIRSLGDGRSIDEASRAHLGAPWNDVVANAMKWQEGWSR